MTEKPLPEIILASASPARRALLQDAGLEFSIQPAQVDENQIKQSMAAENRPAIDAALVLADMKAARISAKNQHALVIGADQVLDLGGKWFDKPVDLDHARDQLRLLRGETHELATAVVVFRDGARLWHHLATPKLTMRNFSDDFLDHYIEKTGQDILSSVGAYQLEGRGVQLFAQIEGDYFSILGLPLLGLLAFLRDHGAITS